MGGGDWGVGHAKKNEFGDKLDHHLRSDFSCNLDFHFAISLSHTKIML
jgi:hypothetical protein